MKHKVAQIIPYFGKWPEWIELYFYSCGKNPMVDFIFYTDCPLPQRQYKNTIFHQCTYNDYCNLINERLSIDFHCKKPYKLTDLKPFIGIIHKQELNDYDFWGMGDLDLVYGNLGMVVNDVNLDKYNVITTQNYHIAGHCCFCRNNEYYRNLCFKIKNWKEKLQNENPLALDEGEWSDLICPFLNNIRRIHKYIFKPFNIHYFKVLDTLNPILHPKIYLHQYSTSPHPQKQKNWIYYSESSKIVDPHKQELPYLHFLFFKKTKWLNTDLFWKDNFYQLTDDISLYKKIVINCNTISGESNND